MTLAIATEGFLPSLTPESIATEGFLSTVALEQTVPSGHGLNRGLFVSEYLEAETIDKVRKRLAAERSKEIGEIAQGEISQEVIEKVKASVVEEFDYIPTIETYNIDREESILRLQAYIDALIEEIIEEEEMLMIFMMLQ